MKKLLTLLLFAGCLLSAQTATFTFGAINPPPNLGQSCAGMVSWNGVVNAYPQDMGGICLAIYPYGYTNINTPQAFGFPNNGFLTNGATTPNQLGFGTPGFTINPDGVTASQSFTANNFYDGLNTTVEAVVQFKRVSHVYCGRTGCHTFYSWVVTGGSGTVTN